MGIHFDHLRLSTFFAISLCVCFVTLRADGESPIDGNREYSPPEWVVKSNEYADALLKPFAKMHPEMAAHLGVEGLDEEIMDIKPGFVERGRQILHTAIQTLKGYLDHEKNPAIRQDLEIGIQAAESFLEDSLLQEKYFIPYYNIPEAVFHGMRSLLDEQVAEQRRHSALVRLRKYAGLEPGTTPLTTLATEHLRERMQLSGLLGPPKQEVEKGLGNSTRFMGGIQKLFDKYGIKGYEPALEQLKKQVEDYEKFVKEDLLPKARTDFKQPAEVYAKSLKDAGIDMPVDELSARARVAFVEIQHEMQALAALVAKEKGFKNRDYRAVIGDLKKDQLVGDSILSHYIQRNADLEEIIRRERIVTLPDRKLRIRLASEAESASIPAPHMSPPRMIGNTGEMGEFVLPLRIPSADAKGDIAFDDFTFEAGSWTLSAHEARPGHELQFASMVERGISIARGLFAMNSVNAEGWALYCEWEVKPFLPLDGQLISLQHRLLRAARAFLDPGIQRGTITQDEAKRILMEDVCMSEAMATQEVERYSFWAPGQAPSYFCGYIRLLELRGEIEFLLADRFDRRQFNDFIISQGLLPPRLLRKAVYEEFVPKFRTTTSTN